MVGEMSTLNKLLLTSQKGFCSRELITSHVAPWNSELPLRNSMEFRTSGCIAPWGSEFRLTSSMEFRTSGCIAPWGSELRLSSSMEFRT